MFRSTLVRFSLLPIAAAAAVLTTGCANMVSTATPISTFSQNAELSGHIHGGNQPVIGADVRLYAAGNTGYGSAPTLYAVTTTANDAFGSFGFTKTAGAGATTTKVYGCPTDGSDPQMYITAKGGSTQGNGNGVNVASNFIIALGKCSTIGAGTFVDMNEVTTVATLAALTQYFAPGNATSDNLNHLGAPASAQAQTAFANGVSTIANMVSVATGVAQASTTSGTPTGSPTAVTVTVTPEITKINTIANILAACVNTTSSTSSACTTLFTNATAPSSSVTSQPALNFGTAVDTLQAGYYMLANPTSGSAANINALYNLTAANAPFQPMLAVAPTDWTVGIRYSSTSACATGTSNFLAYAYHLAVDATGNLWAVSNATTGGNLFELSPAGVPLTCNLGASTGKSTGFAFDTNGNAWVSGAANTNLYKYSPSASTFTTWPTGTTTGIQFVAVDRSGDVIASTSATAGTAVYNFANGASTATPFTATQISSTVGTSPFFMGIDTANRIFVSNSTSSATFYELYPATDAANLNGYDTANVGSTASTANAYGVGAGIAGTIAVANGNYAASAASNTFSLLTPTSSPGAVTAVTSAQYSGGINGPRELAIDGAGNSWVANSTATAGNYVTGAANAATTYSVSEFNAAGGPLSPTGAGTTTLTVTGGFQKDPSVLPVAGRGIAIDPTGNVWIGSNSTTGTGILEIVGAAVPVVTPIASALAAGVTTTNGVSKP